MVDAKLAKRALRARIREKRLFTPPEERRRLAEAITEQLIELVTSLGANTEIGAQSVAIYISTESEPSTLPFIGYARSRGIGVIIPVIREEGKLDWAAWDGGVRATVGPRAIDEVDVIFVPASSVDKTGLRMGWGRGYYDRLLATLSADKNKRPPVYAVIFDGEFVDSLPSEPHDQLVDGVVTPSRTISFTH